MTNDVWLNDCLLTGPKLQKDLFDVLLHWRLYSYVFCADIVKMYRQILVHPKDRHFQKILWSSSGAPSEYELNTLIYGLACAPYLAIRVLRQLARDESSFFSEGVDIINSEMYVADVLSGADTIPIACHKVKQLDQCS